MDLRSGQYDETNIAREYHEEVTKKGKGGERKSTDWKEIRRRMWEGGREDSEDIGEQET